MSTEASDTICAIATAPGRSGIGIVRVSGTQVQALCKQVLGEVPPPRQALFCDFLGADDDIIDQGIAIYFTAPNSFTGEDVLELQGHGGVQVLQALLERVIALGARLAVPGEFSERAFFNDKIDLVQAEAIADLIDASSRQAARSAVRTLQGVFSREVRALVAQLITIRSNVEAAIDFSDEDIDVLSDTGVHQSLEEMLDRLAVIFTRAKQGALLQEGMNVVIAGKPNAGKSSLLNALSGQDSAIVTDIPGTTRDLLKEQIQIDGMPVHVTDTAGLRSSADIVEQEGVRRAQSAIQQADRILLVIDASTDGEEVPETLLEPMTLHQADDSTLTALLEKTTLVFNKIDLCEDPTPRISEVAYKDCKLPLVYLSATLESGIDILQQHLKSCIGFEAMTEGVFVARERHLQALTASLTHLNSAAAGISKHLHLELVAEDLRLAQQHLGGITGEFTSDDLLGEIFASFCIGK